MPCGSFVGRIGLYVMCYTERLDSMFFKEKWLRSVRTRQRKGRFAAAPQGRRGQDASREAKVRDARGHGARERHDRGWLARGARPLVRAGAAQPARLGATGGRRSRGLVNTLIRLPGVHFNGRAGKVPQEAKSGLHILHEDMYSTTC